MSESKADQTTFTPVGRFRSDADAVWVAVFTCDVCAAAVAVLPDADDEDHPLTRHRDWHRSERTSHLLGGFG